MMIPAAWRRSKTAPSLLSTVSLKNPKIVVWAHIIEATKTDARLLEIGWGRDFFWKNAAWKNLSSKKATFSERGTPSSFWIAVTTGWRFGLRAPIHLQELKKIKFSCCDNWKPMRTLFARISPASSRQTLNCRMYCCHRLRLPYPKHTNFTTSSHLSSVRKKDIPNLHRSVGRRVECGTLRHQLSTKIHRFFHVNNPERVLRKR